jgi:phosphoribosylglycinamide formyltransferase 1
VRGHDAHELSTAWFWEDGGRRGPRRVALQLADHHGRQDPVNQQSASVNGIIPELKRPRILVITERSWWGARAYDFVATSGFAATHLVWQHGDPPRPRGLDGWRGEWIVSFKADYILTEAELGAASHGAVNFHPGPPNLRGVGGYEYAIENGWQTFGATCHRMNRWVDHGPIITTASFPIDEHLDVESLREATAARLYLLLIDVLARIRRGRELPTADVGWSGPLHTWAELAERVERMNAPPVGTASRVAAEGSVR